RFSSTAFGSSTPALTTRHVGAAARTEAARAADAALRSLKNPGPPGLILGELPSGRSLWRI
ncbi:MAG TPA: hypothetical protein VF231_10860, partial [Candidatus Limnocylindrales bacterium]